MECSQQMPRSTPSRSRGLEAQARALGTPARFRIFEHIAEAERPVGVAELTELLGINHNAIRQHLAILEGAGLVLQRKELRQGTGRPRQLYAVDPDVYGPWGTSGPCAELAALLSDTLRSGLTPREVGRRAGRLKARRIADDVDGVLAFPRADLLISGFHPRELTSSGQTCFVLGRCPYANVAARNSETVCQLHLGLAEGVVDLLGEDPARAGCRLSVMASEHG